MKGMLFFLLLFSQVGYAQDVEKQLRRVTDTDEALEFIQANPALQGIVFNIYSHYDTAAGYGPLFRKRAGYILTQNGYTYKILADTTAQFSRASYIYLDAAKLSTAQIDSTRTLILKRYQEGVDFKDLAKEYTMDESPNGDTGWFTEDTMVEEFEKALTKHKAPEVFTLDIPRRGWYYVIKKTFEPARAKRLTVLRVKSGS
jgi:hypothetical protein